MIPENNKYDSDKLINLIEENIRDALMGKKFAANELLSVYRTVYEIFSDDPKIDHLRVQMEDSHAETLYLKLKITITEIFDNLKEKIGNVNNFIVIEYLNQLQCIRHAVKSIRVLISYVNRNWIDLKIPNSTKVYCKIDKFIYYIWTKRVYMIYKLRIRDEILDYILKLRNGVELDTQVIRNYCDHFQILSFHKSEDSNDPDAHQHNILNVLKQEFVEYFLETSEKYYKSLAIKLFNKKDIKSYLNSIKSASDAELKRVHDIMHLAFVDDIKFILQRTCISPFLPEIYVEFQHCLEKNKLKDVHYYYIYFFYTDHVLKQFNTIYQNFIRDQLIKNINKLSESSEMISMIEHQNYVEYVNRISSQLNTYDMITSELFDDNQFFNQSKKNAYITAINISLRINPFQMGIAELTANFINFAMKFETRIFDSNYIMNSLRIMSMVDDKTELKKYLEEYLCIRLLDQDHTAYLEEGQLLALMKSTFDEEFTRDMFRMLSDVVQNDGLNTQMRSMAQPPLPDRFKFLILASNIWPISHISDVAVPPDIQSRYDQIIKFYTSNFSNRKSQFFDHLSSVEMDVILNRGTFTFECTGFQACIIYQFDWPNNSLSMSQLQNATKLTYITLSITVFSLIEATILLASTNILECNCDRIPSDTQLTLNLNFKNSSRVVVLKNPCDFRAVASISLDLVRADWHMAIQACIVRVMKIAKTMNYETLISKVYLYLDRFQIDENLIKKGLSILCERGFLESSDNLKTINYLDS